MLAWIGSIITLDLGALPLGCIFNINFFTTLIVRTALPLVVILGLKGLNVIFQRKEMYDFADVCTSAWFYVHFLIWPSCAGSSIARPAACLPPHCHAFC